MASALVLSRAETRERMFQAICDVCVAEGGFSHTSIRWLDDNTSLLQTMACASEPGADFSLNQPPMATADSVYGRGPSGRALRTRSVQLVNNVNEDASRRLGANGYSTIRFVACW
ncbi:GAF domain-containing protein [Paludibacterium denitrificans]|uniref:GAF domain-containing protein n=1 Tax=Paludibacterium denitrificans TaxID=2675226 RepID=A0A844GEG7_9NEIS|nr:GAF domain-containing protein [Paludibacterium denitrificans]MTD34049.1 GAF domain-containing protein [Paludibacterium denitrificans]